MVIAPASAEESIFKLYFLTSDRGESKLFTNFATCQLFLDFSDHIVRHNNLSVHVQGSNTP